MYFGLKQLIYLSILTAFLSNKVWCGVGEICNSTETDITNCAENTTGYICINDTCACDKNYYNDDTNSTCESKSSFEGNCSDNGTCLENMTCINNQCGCDESFYHDNNSCLNKSSFEGNCFNGRCLGNMICIENNTCGCDVSFYHDNNICLNKSNFEENCSDNGTCLENMTCINNQCGCDESFYHDNNSCLNKPGYGENCISLPDNCNVNNGSCNGTTCICNDNFYTDVKQCKPVSGLQPTDFKVTTTNDSFAFDWKSPISVVIIQFIISGDNSNGFKNITIDKNLTTATIRGLQQGTRYYNIKVAAIVNTDRGEVHVDSTNTINDTTSKCYIITVTTSSLL
ncbi:hypothetical protein SNE40_019860 [Patella caerulea]|uniref:Fibronectin type-III domain-containing protein n=1 Tax=Patella caerulea TaxID=87958 RepID=A0AAN8GH98_PATCE